MFSILPYSYFHLFVIFSSSFFPLFDMVLFKFFLHTTHKRPACLPSPVSRTFFIAFVFRPKWPINGARNIAPSAPFASIASRRGMGRMLFSKGPFSFLFLKSLLCAFYGSLCHLFLACTNSRPLNGQANQRSPLTSHTTDSQQTNNQRYYG